MDTEGMSRELTDKHTDSSPIDASDEPGDEYGLWHRVALGSASVLFASTLQVVRLIEGNPQYDRLANTMTYAVLGTSVAWMALHEVFYRLRDDDN